MCITFNSALMFLLKPAVVCFVIITVECTTSNCQVTEFFILWESPVKDEEIDERHSKLEMEGQTYDLPIITGSQDESRYRKLRAESGYITLVVLVTLGQFKVPLHLSMAKKVFLNTAVFQSKRSLKKATLLKQATF